MRRIMRNALLLTGLVIVVLLAVGAVPSYLGSGETYYLEATATDEPGRRSTPATSASDGFRISRPP